MLTITITIGAIIAIVLLVLQIINLNKEVKGITIKYEATKTFADTSAKRILNLQNSNENLANHVKKLEAGKMKHFAKKQNLKANEVTKQNNKPMKARKMPKPNAL